MLFNGFNYVQERTDFQFAYEQLWNILIQAVRRNVNRILEPHIRYWMLRSSAFPGDPCELPFG